MNAVTITQITPTELEILIEKAVSKTLAALEREPAPDPDAGMILRNSLNTSLTN